MTMDADPDFADVIAAELGLLNWTTRGDRDALDRVLAPDFAEIGKSGKLWTRSEILDSLTHEGELEQPEARDFTARLIARDLVLLTFVTSLAGARTRRSSLWRHADDTGWQIVFHQGTASND